MSDVNLPNSNHSVAAAKAPAAEQSGKTGAAVDRSLVGEICGVLAFLLLCLVAWHWWSVSKEISSAVTEARQHIHADKTTRISANDRLKSVIVKYEGSLFGNLSEAKKVSVQLASERAMDTR